MGSVVSISSCRASTRGGVASLHHHGLCLFVGSIFRAAEEVSPLRQPRLNARSFESLVAEGSSKARQARKAGVEGFASGRELGHSD